MTATSKNIESIVKQWISFDLKTIQVNNSLLVDQFVYLIVSYKKENMKLSTSETNHLC
jgi:hypothetical protein